MSKVQWVIKTKLELITALTGDNLFHWITIIFSTYFSSPLMCLSHTVMNSVVVVVVLLRSQLITNSHFHFLIIVEPAISQVSLHRPKRSPVKCGHSARHCNPTHRTSDMIAVAFVLQGTSGTSTLLFGSQEQRMGRSIFDSNEEVEMGICEWLWIQRARILPWRNFYTCWKMGKMHHCTLGLCRR